MELVGAKGWWTWALGRKPALVFQGRAYIHLVYLSESGVVKRSLKLEKLKDLYDMNYDSKTMAKKLLEVGSRRGITKEAEELLKRV